MTDKNDCEKACEDVSRALMEASAAQDRATRKLLNLADEVLKAQKCFGDADDLKCGKVHPNAFSDMMTFVGSAIANSTGVRQEVTAADRAGQAICDMGGVPMPTGGGGGKGPRLMREFYLADVYRIDKAKHRIA